ncbi:MAG: DUF2007 domain-containing protein [Candidatus Aminicenantes bacterium]|nr:MAG: DUF2007 domain-containing protein [Candidatus Aminicenantes bacterium]
MDNTDNKKNKSEEDMELKELHKVWGPVEAEVVKGYLESNGIPCIFRGKVVQSVHPFSADGLGEIKIFVAEKDYSKAKELLEKKVGI